VRTCAAYVHQSWKDRDSHHNQNQANSRPQGERYETVPCHGIWVSLGPWHGTPN
jgi:hypothetical protein